MIQHSIPKLKVAVDLATMKLDKARLDAEEERARAENALRLTEEYCNSLIYPGGVPSDVTNLVEGRNIIAGEKERDWANMNATILQLQERRREEAERKLKLAAFEVECKKKLVYLERACPTDPQELLSRTSDKLPSPISHRCLECGGTVIDSSKEPEATRSAKGKQYCAWPSHKCWEIDFISGRCQPPPGYAPKCYHAHMLDPIMAKAVKNYLSTKERKEALLREKSEKPSLLELRAMGKAAVGAAAASAVAVKGDDGQAYWLPPASGDASAGGAAPASPGTSQYSVSPQAFYGGEAGAGGGAAAPTS